VTRQPRTSGKGRKRNLAKPKVRLSGKVARTVSFPEGYAEFFEQVRARILQAQTRAAFAANRELLHLYWEMGKDIVHRQERERWGTAVIERLAQDLGGAFPGVAGFSTRNLWRMRAFYLAYPPDSEVLPQPVAEIETSGRPFLPQAVAELPWGHQVILLEKLKEPAERQWYARATIEHGWSRNVLVHQIDSGLHRRQGKALTNFHRVLASPQSDLAQGSLKDPYVFDFFTLGSEVRERDLERALLAHVRKFLLELGAGFALVGSQYHLEVGGEDFYLDLLFYHLDLRSYVVIELKSGHFQPEHAGKMNFYLSAVDHLLRKDGDQPTIGLILCRAQNRMIAEYSLQGLEKPIGLATYQLMPEHLREILPSPEQLETELEVGVPLENLPQPVAEIGPPVEAAS
jgi:predicted nuclease of restriction endonuclease-like (RecB) superfamily